MEEAHLLLDQVPVAVENTCLVLDQIPVVVEDTLLVLDQIPVAVQEVSAGLKGAGLTGVGGQTVAVVLIQTPVKGLLFTHLSECLLLFTGMTLCIGAGQGRGLWVMRTQTRGGGATEGLCATVFMATVAEEMRAGEIFSR